MKGNAQVVKISVFITSIFVIVLSISYAFLGQTLFGTKKQVLSSGNLELKLEEQEEITLENALPVYDEVGMIGKPFVFSITNPGDKSLDYRVKLVKVPMENELFLEDVKYLLTKQEVKKLDVLSNIQEDELDHGSILGGETIHYSLRLWIDSSVEEEKRISGKSLKYRIDVEVMQAKEYAVTFEVEGGMMEEYKMIANASREEVLPIPVKAGYQFIGWYTAKEEGERIEKTNEITEDGRLYARWEKGRYTVTFNTNGGGSNTTKEVVYTENYGELPIPTREGYKFLGWYTEKSGGERIDSSTKVSITSNQTLYAHWEQPPLLSAKKQGDYVAYVGNNGCRNNGVDTTGTKDAESKNSCLGWNANQLDADTTTFGYCYSSSYKYTVTGWRIAYTENNRAYLISAGSPECNTRTASTGNTNYISFANQRAKKYCNSLFVDGECTDNSDSWAIGDADFYKMTSVINNGNGKYLISGSDPCLGSFNTLCGLNHSLFNNGGYYYFAEAFHPQGTSGVAWEPIEKRVYGFGDAGAYGLRPIIRLSSSVYITGGSGTMNDPYTIAND